MEIRAVVNQIGVAMELHGHGPSPITLDLINYQELGAYRAELAKSNPDYRHAVIGQLAVMYANLIYPNRSHDNACISVSPFAWTYNASTDTYDR